VKRFFLFLMLSGCALTQRVESAFDCSAVCERYASCYDTSYDTDACKSRCRRAAAEDPDYRRRADMCEACISQRSCAAATFSCLTECVSVVP
jgi:hypothetical protein